MKLRWNTRLKNAGALRRHEANMFLINRMSSVTSNYTPSLGKRITVSTHDQLLIELRRLQQENLELKAERGRGCYRAPELRRYHILYRINVIPTEEFYVGMHSTDIINDGYMGSGVLIKQRVRDYGYDFSKFRKEILNQYSNRNELIRAEKIEREKILIDPKCLNRI